MIYDNNYSQDENDKKSILKNSHMMHKQENNSKFDLQSWNKKVNLLKQDENEKINNLYDNNHINDNSGHGH